MSGMLLLVILNKNENGNVDLLNERTVRNKKKNEHGASKEFKNGNNEEMLCLSKFHSFARESSTAGFTFSSLNINNTLTGTAKLKIQISCIVTQRNLTKLRETTKEQI